MRLSLIATCDDDMCFDRLCPGEQELTDPDAILAALAEAGVLEVESGRQDIHPTVPPRLIVRYVSPWKEAE